VAQAHLQTPASTSVSPLRHAAEVYSFGAFHLLPARQLLLNGDVRVRLGSRALQILVMLVERSGELVSKEELIACAWPDTCVEDNNLKVQIAALRRVLSPEAESPQFIATSNGRGYCFVAAVERASAHIQWTAGAPLERGPTNNLPALTYRVLGRESTVNALTEQLSRHRLVTLTGTGGIGKTTVAVTVAQRLLGSYPDGVGFLDLASVRDPRLIPGTLGSAFGIGVEVQDSTTQLLRSFRERRILVVLDNCEHLVTAAAAFAAQLVSALPHAHVLVTGRECLRAPGERVHRLAPLEVPPVNRTLTAAEATAYSAVALFVERATASVEHFELTDADASSVAEICRKLDGLPLAIELAATRMDAFAPQELLGLLQSRRDILTQSARYALPRQQTLEASLEWSYELLSDSEKTLLCHLSAFDLPFSIESACAVAADEGISRATIIETLAGLVSKSLVCAQKSGGNTRYHLLNTTRAYALEKHVTDGMLDSVPRRLSAQHRDTRFGKEG
jgi:predicted ATPase/DNA-binding winged helix-turn-helix (wHTH) protein